MNIFNVHGLTVDDRKFELLEKRLKPDEGDSVPYPSPNSVGRFSHNKSNGEKNPSTDNNLILSMNAINQNSNQDSAFSAPNSFDVIKENSQIEERQPNNNSNDFKAQNNSLKNNILANDVSISATVVASELSSSNLMKRSSGEIEVVELLDSSRERSPKLKRVEETDNSPLNVDNGSRGATGGNATNKRTIQDFFINNKAKTISNTNSNVNSNQDSAIQNITMPTISNSSLSNHSDNLALDISSTVTSKKESKASAAKAQQLSDKLADKQYQTSINDFKKQMDQIKSAKEQVENKLQRTEAELKVIQERLKASEDKNVRCTKMLEDVYRKMAFQEFRRKRDKIAQDSVRLGKIGTMRTGPTQVGEVWEEGYGLKDLNKRSAELLERKEELEQRRKRTLTLKRAAKKGSANANNNHNNEFSTSNVIPDEENDIDLDLVTEVEVIKSHLEQLKRDETALAEERRLLESEKAIHQKELKRCQCEERSRFYRDLPVLHDRYLLQSMLGRGGFSEVWKALDLVELKEVAVKIHQLNPTWNEDRKQSYIKHVTREYTIHRDMRHPRVVQLFDVFEIDINSFATVLEYCKGIDLDEKLKRNRTLAEKDAKCVFMQIMSGLRYLNRPLSYSSASNSTNNNNNNNFNNDKNEFEDNENIMGMNNNNKINGRKISIIHFDLKPANILFDEMGDVKITDFGLSKIIDEANEGTSMELTSQGAGTYWYLPPECFAKGTNPPRISSKVDVWSAGIIFYQMLYGYRPYGEGKSQENVWADGLIYNASQVEFTTDPKAPKVSEEAKDLIRLCLTRDVKY
eukprot:gene5996-8255_t